MGCRARCRRCSCRRGDSSRAAPTRSARDRCQPGGIPRCAAGEHEVLDDGDDVLGGAGTVDPDRQRLAGVLVNDVAQLEPALVGGLVEHEVDRPHVTGMRGAQPLLLTRTYPPALACPHGTPQALLAPDPACALAIDRPTLPQQDLMRGLPTPTRMLPAIPHRRAARRCSSVLGGRRGLRCVERF